MPPLQQYYLHSMKTVATFPALLALLLVKPVCLSPRPFSFSPLSQHSLLQFMSLSLSCSSSVLHFSPLIKHEKRPYWFIWNKKSFIKYTSDHAYCNNTFICPPPPPHTFLFRLSSALS
jgi:hypothetical protein